MGRSSTDDPSLGVIGFSDSDVQVNVFKTKRVKVSSVRFILQTRSEGRPRRKGHTIWTSLTDVPLPTEGKEPVERRESEVKVRFYPDGTVWVDPKYLRTGA